MKGAPHGPCLCGEPHVLSASLCYVDLLLPLVKLGEECSD